MSEKLAQLKKKGGSGGTDFREYYAGVAYNSTNHTVSVSGTTKGTSIKYLGTADRATPTPTATITVNGTTTNLTNIYTSSESSYGKGYVWQGEIACEVGVPFSATITNRCEKNMDVTSLAVFA